MRLKASPRVVVVGGGVAGLEAVVALRSLAGERVTLELISPERAFAYRPLSIAAVFGAPAPAHLEVAAVARSVEAELTVDSLVAVDVRRRELTLGSGTTTSYDILVLATGAVPIDTIPGAVAFGTPGAVSRVRAALAEAQAGRLRRIVFAVPNEVVWPLALYELALLTADRLRRSGSASEVMLVTPEPAPLAIFGGRASGAVLEQLEESGVRFQAGVHCEEVAWGELRAHPGNVRITADVVITLPKLRGRLIAGVPADEEGFLPVNAHALVRGTTDVYGAGDATATPIKHGSLAAQQADAAAEAIAARVGAPVDPAPFRPVLRGMLLTGREPRYLEAAVRGDGEPQADTSTSPLWWPPAKVAARYLGPYLSGQVSGPPQAPPGVPVEVELADAQTLGTAAAG